ncbi:hypothetical protein LTR94_026199, partial [Friedmanniomyces endolithicus]
MFTVSSFSAIVFASALSQTAAQPAPSAPEPAAAPAAPTERVVCRRERVVGSNRPQRICMTQGQRERQSDESRQMMDRANQ